PKFLFRLYEAPPDPVGILYPNGMRFHGADIERSSTPGGPIYHEGEPVQVRFWWSVDHPVALDYSLSLLVYGGATSGGTTQLDGPPHPTAYDGTPDPTATSQWKPGQLYIDEWDIPLPYPLTDGTYPIWMALYYWQDPKRLVAPGVDARGLLNVGQVLVHAW
ncbi:MAG TPA: hypothetical protein VG963_11565, partial [Polyangiaceae bacterium]|nr:hypothetical protein [Polyangiaceae bacterium]